VHPLLEFRILLTGFYKNGYSINSVLPHTVSTWFLDGRFNTCLLGSWPSDFIWVSSYRGSILCTVQSNHIYLITDGNEDSKVVSDVSRLLKLKSGTRSLCWIRFNLNSVICPKQIASKMLSRKQVSFSILKILKHILLVFIYCHTSAPTISY